MQTIDQTQGTHTGPLGITAGCGVVFSLAPADSAMHASLSFKQASVLATIQFLRAPLGVSVSQRFG